MQKLQNDTKILAAYRVADNTIRLDFDVSGRYLFDLASGAILRPTKDEFIKKYQAPFDNILSKSFSKSKIISISLSKNDKIIQIKAQSEQGYKSFAYELLLEMTPKSKNAIILGSDNLVIGALRYDSLDSGRQIRVGSPLDELPHAPFEFVAKPQSVVDIDTYLDELSQDKLSKQLSNLKNTKIAGLHRKIQNLSRELQTLSSADKLVSQAGNSVAAANFALMNMQSLDIYAKTFDFIGEDGKNHSIAMPKVKKPSDVHEWFFQRAKKLKKKALGVAQESENLSGKVSFFEKLISIVSSAKSDAEIEFYLPKQIKNDKQKSDGDIYEILIDGAKVYVGKNSKGNEKILKLARANDTWFHLKDIPSAHTLLSTGKNEPSRGLLEKTAKICAEFSLSKKGGFEVDFAKRRDVSPKGGGKAEYVNYKTIQVYLD